MRTFRISMSIVTFFACFGCQMDQPVAPTVLPDHPVATPDSGYDMLCQFKNEEHFGSEQMVRVTNTLRQLGKKQAIDVLARYLRDHASYEGQFTTAIICRLLFVPPPGGWERALFGAPFPAVDMNTVFDQFPLFPLAMSHGVPFLVTAGFSFQGMSTQGVRTLQKCLDLDLISKDLPNGDIEKATDDLFKTPAFLATYPDGPRQYVESVIRLRMKKLSAAGSFDVRLTSILEGPATCLERPHE